MVLIFQQILNPLVLVCYLYCSPVLEYKSLYYTCLKSSLSPLKSVSRFRIQILLFKSLSLFLFTWFSLITDLYHCCLFAPGGESWDWYHFFSSCHSFHMICLSLSPSPQFFFLCTYFLLSKLSYLLLFFAVFFTHHLLNP